MVLSPMPAHESVLTVLKCCLTCLLDSILVSYKVHLEVESAALVSVLPEVSWIPDAVVKLWSKHNMKSQRLWLIKSTFSQTDANIMDKLHRFVLAVLDLLVICKISFEKTHKFKSLSLKDSTVKPLWSAPLLTKSKWKQCVEEEFADIMMEGHMWFFLSSLVVHVWVRPPDNCNISINQPVHGSYSTGIHTFRHSFICIV